MNQGLDGNIAVKGAADSGRIVCIPPACGTENHWSRRLEAHISSRYTYKGL